MEGLVKQHIFRYVDLSAIPAAMKKNKNKQCSRVSVNKWNMHVLRGHPPPPPWKWPSPPPPITLEVDRPLGTQIVFISGFQFVPRINPFKPEFTIVIFIHYKSRIAVAILDL